MHFAIESMDAIVKLFEYSVFFIDRVKGKRAAVASDTVAVALATTTFGPSLVSRVDFLIWCLTFRTLIAVGSGLCF